MTLPGRTVLVVDDTPSKRYLIASYLRRGGFNVIEAQTGAQALDRFAEGGIDLVVLDVRLPDMSGFEVCEQLKAHPTLGTIPVVHVSAAATESIDRTQGLERGADAYLVEPIDPDELIATVTSILRYYQARLEAELLAARLAGLVRVTGAMSSATDRRSLLDEAVRGGSEIFGSPIVIIADDTDGTRLLGCSDGPGTTVLIAPATVDRDGELVGARFRDEPAANWPQAAFRDDDLVRVVSVRTRLDRPAIYVAVRTATTMDGAPVLLLFGQALQSALDTLSQFDAEHDLALTLQRSLLPRRLAAVAGFDFAVRYVPASDHAEIGGDFYEVVHLDGQVFVAVGDVGGHSLHAATVMAEVRHSMRAYLAEGHGPAETLDRLNGLMTKLIPGEIATLCLLSVDCETGLVRLANAGHPPPIWCAPSGVRLLPDHGPLLGIVLQPARQIEFTLGEGETLVLYTDGLIERRSHVIDDGIGRLAQASRHVEADLELYASRLLAEVGPAEPDDDIALVAIRRRFSATSADQSTATVGALGTAEHIHSRGESLLEVTPPVDASSYTVHPSRLAALRAEVAARGRQAGLAQVAVEDLVLAVNELLTNVVRHGGGEGRLRLWADGRWLYCEVSDHGSGMSASPASIGTVRPEASSSTGRGLWMIRRLVNRFRMQTGPGGTTVTLAMPTPSPWPVTAAQFTE
ncbi:MAG: SpoIIE family protein phosphatase [Hamadaea sp.]|nr:SpoIIE family protein phosphatase [Hamadaea sp.]NUT02331.1 SpoIIE family protein phosphatase [Hamadaea sp.]